MPKKIIIIKLYSVVYTPFHRLSGRDCENLAIDIALFYGDGSKGILSSSIDGFYAELYKNNYDQYFLVFIGTDDLADVFADGKQVLQGKYEEQYKRALEIGQEVSVKLRKLKKDLFVIGHSMGGGQAQTVSLEYNIPCITINSAGPAISSTWNKPNASKLINAYFIKGEILTYFQAGSYITSWGLPNSVGNQIGINSATPFPVYKGGYLYGPHWMYEIYKWRANNHKMGEVMKAVKK